MLHAGIPRDLEGNPTGDIVDDDLDFYGLREYEPGDDVRNVHWLSSAKTGTLLADRGEREIAEITQAARGARRGLHDDDACRLRQRGRHAPNVVERFERADGEAVQRGVRRERERALREVALVAEPRLDGTALVAKTGTLMIRQFEATRRTDTSLSLGVNPDDYVDAVEFELAVSAHASIGVQALREDRPLYAHVGATHTNPANPMVFLDECSAVEPRLGDERSRQRTVEVGGVHGVEVHRIAPMTSGRSLSSLIVASVKSPKSRRPRVAPGAVCTIR